MDNIASLNQFKNENASNQVWTHKILSEIVSQAVDKHLAASHDELSDSMHTSIVKLVELPMLQKVLSLTNHNQVQAAKMIGISRGTLRKKVKENNLI